MLTDLALPGYTGFDKIATNLGTIRNSGFEAEVREMCIRDSNKDPRLLYFFQKNDYNSNVVQAYFCLLYTS